MEILRTLVSKLKGFRDGPTFRARGKHKTEARCKKTQENNVDDVHWLEWSRHQGESNANNVSATFSSIQ